MKDDVIKFIDSLHINYRIVDHPAVYNVADICDLPEDIKPIKNLLLQESGSGQMFLVAMAGNARLDINAIRKQLNTKRLSFCGSEALMSTFGVEPGSVSIFGLLHHDSKNVKLIIDEEIFKDDELGFHPNENTSTLLLQSKNLEHVLHEMGCDYKVMKLY